MESSYTRVQTRVAVAGGPEALPVERFPELVRRGFDAWLTMRGQAAMPRRADLDPFLLADEGVLPHVMLFAVRDAEPHERFLCRLVGEEAMPFGERGLRGRTLAEIHGANFETIYRDYAQVAETGTLHYAERTAVWADRAHRFAARVLMPLGEADWVTHILAVVEFLPFDPDRT